MSRSIRPIRRRSTASPLSRVRGSSSTTRPFRPPAALRKRCSDFNIANGSIDNSFFGSAELTGTGTGATPNTNYGVKVFGAAANTAFEQNIIDISDIHLTKLAGVQVGINSTNQANYRQNTWRIGGIRAAGGVTTSTWGSKDLIQIGAITNEEAAYNRGLVTQSGADSNQFRVGQILGASVSNVVDGGANTILVTEGAITAPSLLGRAGNSTANIRAPGLIAAKVTATGTGADVTEDTLQIFTLPANAFDVVGRGVHIEAWGTTGADANTKIVRLYFGAKIYDSTAIPLNNGGWYLWANVYKTGSNTQTAVATSVFGNSNPATNINALAQIDTSGIVIKVTGQNSAAVTNDIVCSGMTVQFLN